LVACWRLAVGWSLHSRPANQGKHQHVTHALRDGIPAILLCRHVDELIGKLAWDGIVGGVCRLTRQPGRWIRHGPVRYYASMLHPYALLTASPRWLASTQAVMPPVTAQLFVPLASSGASCVGLVTLWWRALAGCAGVQGTGYSFWQMFWWQYT
jgi:hypothetical protein